MIPEERPGLGVFLSVVSPVYPAGRGASFIMASSIIPRESCAPARRFPVDAILRDAESASRAPARSSASPVSLHPGHHAWELSKRAQRAVRVINYRGRINWNSFRCGAPNLSRERKFRHPSSFPLLPSPFLFPCPDGSSVRERVFGPSSSRD